MKYAIRISSGFVSGQFIEMAHQHKQKITDIIIMVDDGECFDYISAEIETESKALADYFLRKLGAKLIDKNNKVYEVS